MRFVLLTLFVFTACNITFMEKPVYHNSDPTRPIIPEMSESEVQFECWKLQKLTEMPVRDRDGHWHTLVVHLNGTCKGIKPIEAY